MTKRLLLIQPEEARSKFDFDGIIVDEPLELEYLSAAAKNADFVVRFLDFQLKQEDLSGVLADFRPDAAYMCGKMKHESFLLEYCREIKAFDDSCVTIVGGIHPQLNPTHFFETCVDYVVRSFDPAAVIKILESEFGDKLPSEEVLRSIGVCTRRRSISDTCADCNESAGSVAENVNTGDNSESGKQGSEWLLSDAVPCDINNFPRPDRRVFYENRDKYRYLELTGAAAVRTAFCCPYKCSFCHRNKLNCGRYTARNIDDVVDEIAGIDAENIYILDDDFLVNVKRIERFIELIREREIHKKYIVFGRSDFIVKHRELMAELAEIGLYYVLVGLESSDENELIAFNKLNSAYNNSKSIEICHELGIHMMAMFILGLEYTGRDFKKLYQYTKRKKLKHVAVSVFVPEPGLPEAEKYKDRIITTDPEKYDYLHLVAKPSKLSISGWYFHYYVLLIRLFISAKRQGVYDFLDYRGFILTFIRSILGLKKSEKAEGSEKI